MKRYLGLDLGGTNIKVAVIEQAGDDPPVVIHDDKVRTQAAHGPEHVRDRLVGVGRTTAAEYGPLDAVGLGVPGLFDPEGGTIELFPNLPGPWKGFPLRDEVADGLAIPTTMINDARAFTLAEGTIGAGRDARVMLGVTLGTGIGGGLMIDGRIHEGSFGMAGEFGHQTVEPHGPVCGCGNRGCLEAVAKGSAIAMAAGVKNAEAAYAAAGEGDPAALKATHDAVFYMAIGIANVVVIVGADTIVMGGGIMSAGSLVLDPLRAAVDERLTLVGSTEVTIVKAALGGRAGAIGAALAGKGQLPTRAR
ncbi:MAG: ROK family protein [Acidimicrobiia bacterium]|nr:ROK family protein [Acidimicrobiia bacterium]